MTQLTTQLIFSILTSKYLATKSLLTSTERQLISDKPTALLPSSPHPGHIAPTIVYRMAFRLLRICSIEASFEVRLSELKNNFLVPRGYKPKLIESQFDRILFLPGYTFEEKHGYSLEKQMRDDKNKDQIIVS